MKCQSQTLSSSSSSSVLQDQPGTAAQLWPVWSWWITQKPSCQRTRWGAWPRSGRWLSATGTSERASSAASHPGWVPSSSWRHSPSLVSQLLCKYYVCKYFCPEDAHKAVKGKTYIIFFRPPRWKLSGCLYDHHPFQCDQADAACGHHSERHGLNCTKSPGTWAPGHRAEPLQWQPLQTDPHVVSSAQDAQDTVRQTGN